MDRGFERWVGSGDFEWVDPGLRRRLLSPGVSSVDDLFQFVLVAVEAELAEDGEEFFEFQALDGRGVQGEVDGDVTAEGDELFGEGEAWGGFAEFFAAFAFDFVGVGEEVVEGAVVLEELCRGLFADAVDAGDVVDGVAHEGEHVDDLVGAEAGFFHEAGSVEGQVGVDIEERDVGLSARRGDVEELFEVFVLGDHADFEVGVLGAEAVDEGGEDVVGFEAGGGDHGDADFLEEGEAAVDLGHEVVGGLLAVGFVLGVELAAEGGLVAADVERNGDKVGLACLQDVGALGLEQLEEHSDEPKGHVGGFFGDRARHRRTDSVVVAEELAVAVDEVEGGHGLFPLASWPLPCTMLDLENGNVTADDRKQDPIGVEERRADFKSGDP